MATFKVLSYCGNFVDENLLSKGIYTTTLPILRLMDTSMEIFEANLRWLKDLQGNSFISDSYFENLQKCKFITVELNIVSDGDK